MEFIEVTQTPTQRDGRVACLSWTQLAAQQAAAGRGLHVLMPGERVVLRSDDGECYAGQMLTSAEFAGEPSYVIEVGVRLPAAWAALRTGRRDLVRDEADLVDAEIVEDTAEVIGLLGDLRALGAGPAVPAPRTGTAAAYAVPQPRRPLLDTLL